MSVFYWLLLYLVVIFKISVKGVRLFCCSINVTQLGKRDGQTSKKKIEASQQLRILRLWPGQCVCMWMCVHVCVSV